MRKRLTPQKTKAGNPAWGGFLYTYVPGMWFEFLASDFGAIYFPATYSINGRTSKQSDLPMRKKRIFPSRAEIRAT